MNGATEPILGICDRCMKRIPKNNESDVAVVREIHYKMDHETYQLHFLICKECKKEFDDWIFSKTRI